MPEETLSRTFWAAAFACLVLAASPASGVPPRPAAPALPQRGGAPPTPTPWSPPAGYTQAVDCPASAMNVGIIPATAPAGWSSLGWHAVLAPAKATVEEQSGHQVLWCSYPLNDSDSHALFSLRRSALPPTGSCIPNPSKPGFLCKPGSVQ